jgi:hypothetical protein
MKCSGGITVLSLTGIVIVLLVSALVGKHSRPVRLTTYGIAAILALLQVLMVLYDMYTQKLPEL